jgi:hypothetical protein
MTRDASRASARHARSQIGTASGWADSVASVTATSPRDLPTDAGATSRYPLAAAAFSALQRSATAVPEAPDAVAAWRFPTLPASVIEAASAAFGVTIVADEAAEDPRDSPAFAALFAHARAEQIVRALARRTNLVLPAARALVIGDGPVAEVIASILGRGGSRVVRGITDPVVRLRAHLSGERTATAPWPAADIVITTGETTHPLSKSATGSSPALEITIHAPRTAGGTAAATARGPAGGTAEDSARPFVTKTGVGSWTVAIPNVFEIGDGASDRIADALIALSILRIRTTDARTTDADARLAELVLA